MKVLIPHRPASSDCKVRSTLLASSRQGLFGLDHEDGYRRALEPEREAAIREATMVTQWLSVSVAEEHYRAADALGLSTAELHHVGNVVGQRLEGSLMGTLVRLAKTGGANPWTVLGRLDRIWGRMYQGDSIAVFQPGPKDAIVEIRDNPLADIPYWRIALVGLMQGTTAVFARSAYVTLENQTRAGTARYALSWA